MGICQSCLGRHDGDAYEESVETRLLYDDGHGQYGCFNDHDHHMGGDDTIEAQREHEALQRVVDKTSENMVDVFEIGPDDATGCYMTSSNPFAYAGRWAGSARYQHLVSKLNTDNERVTQKIKVDFLTDEDEHVEMKTNQSASIKSFDDETKGPLVGTFADAAAAME